jgi:hypothetical protein
MGVESQALEKEVAAALLAAGFNKINKRKFKRPINSETELFVYPGVRSGRSYVQLEPIVGIENASLTSRLKALDPKQDTRVCHTFLGFIEGVRPLWNGSLSLYAAKGDSTAHMVQLFIQALERFAFPKFKTYNSKEKVAELLRLYAQSFRNVDVVILDAKEKLALLTDH